MKKILLRLLVLTILIKTISFASDTELLDEYSSFNISNDAIEIVIQNKYPDYKYIEYYKINKISRLTKTTNKQQCRLNFFNNSNHITPTYIIDIEKCNMLIEKYYGKNYTQ